MGRWVAIGGDSLIYFSVIKKIDGERRVGAICHDPDSQRIAFSSTDGLLRDVLRLKFTDPVAFRVGRVGNMNVREKLPMNHPDYLPLLIHKLPPPYSVYLIGRRSGELLEVLGQVYKKYVGNKEGKTVILRESQGKIVIE